VTRTRSTYRVHFLKSLPLYFEEVATGRKDFEVRRGDRPFAYRDLVVLREWDSKKGYTGRELVREIGDVPLRMDDAGMPGYVSFPIRRLE